MSSERPAMGEAVAPSGPPSDLENWRRKGEFLTCGGMGEHASPRSRSVPEDDPVGGQA